MSTDSEVGWNRPESKLNDSGSWLSIRVDFKPKHEIDSFESVSTRLISRRNLRSLIFENISQFNFCSADFNAYDDNVTFYETARKNSKQTFINSFMFVIYEVSEEEKSLIISIKTMSFDALYDEESESKKKSHHEQITSDWIELILISIKRIIKRKFLKKNWKEIKIAVVNEHVWWRFECIREIYFSQTDIED